MATKKKEVKTQVFSLLRDLTDSDKCPPQSRAIVGVLKKLGGKNIGRKEILDGLRAPGIVSTAQSIERIFGFYRPRLIEMGVMKEDVSITHIDVEVPDKPAKEAKAPKAEKAGEVKASDAKAPKADAVQGHKGTAKSA